MGKGADREEYVRRKHENNRWEKLVTPNVVQCEKWKITMNDWIDHIANGCERKKSRARMTKNAYSESEREGGRDCIEFYSMRQIT